MKIRRGMRGRMTSFRAVVRHRRVIDISRGEGSKHLEETIFATEDEMIELALSIINKQPALKLAENKEVRKLARAILAIKSTSEKV